MALIKCTECGKEFSDKATACPNCGCPHEPQQHITNPNESSIVCPTCGSHNIDITFIQSGAKTRTKNIGAPTKLGRKAMKKATFGLWGLTGSRKEYSSVSYKNQKTAICKDCGYSWPYTPPVEADKKSSKAAIIAIIIFFLIVISIIAESISPPESSGDKNTNSSIWLDGYTNIEDFEYSLNGNEIYIGDYNGHANSVRLSSNYKINDTDCHIVSFDNATFIFSDVKSVVIPEGTLTLADNTFNSSDIMFLYLPSTLSSTTQNFFNYFHDLKTLYYGGSQEQWNTLTAGITMPEGVKIEYQVNPENLK